MVSGFVTSPYDHDFISSGDARITFNPEKSIMLLKFPFCPYFNPLSILSPFPLFLFLNLILPLLLRFCLFN